MNLSRKQLTRILVLAASYVAVEYFAIGLYWSFRLVLSGGIGVTYVLPYVGIAAIFVVAIVLGHTRRVRLSAAALAVGLVVSIAACAYDLRNGRCQVQGGGVGQTYTIWWWYYEPYWHDYTPGSV